MGCLKSKETQFLIEFLDRTQKSTASRQKMPKKVPLETRGFCTHFLLLTTLYVMFERKKLKVLIEFLDGTKKVQLAAKKSTASRQKKFP